MSHQKHVVFHQIRLLVLLTWVLRQVVNTVWLRSEMWLVGTWTSWPRWVTVRSEVSVRCKHWLEPFTVSCVKLNSDILLRCCQPARLHLSSVTWCQTADWLWTMHCYSWQPRHARYQQSAVSAKHSSSKSFSLLLMRISTLAHTHDKWSRLASADTTRFVTFSLFCMYWYFVFDLYWSIAYGLWLLCHSVVSAYLWRSQGFWVDVHVFVNTW